MSIPFICLNICTHKMYRTEKGEITNLAPFQLFNYFLMLYQLLRYGGWLNDEMRMMWEMSWHILRYYMCFEALKKSHEHSVRIVTGRDLIMYLPNQSQICYFHANALSAFQLIPKPTHMAWTILLFILVSFSPLQAEMFDMKWNICCLCSRPSYNCFHV